MSEPAGDRMLPADRLSPAAYGALVERVLARGWHLLDPEIGAALPDAGPGVAPGALLPGCLDEPVLLSRDAEGAERLLSNVCTHRAALLVDAPGPSKRLRCPYHGRRFGLDGRCEAAPGFEGLAGLLGPDADLPQLGLGSLGPLRFGAIAPMMPLNALLDPVLERIGWLPLDRLRPVPALHQDHLVAAHWALYLDNYLEGLHIPFVHPALNAALDMGAYQDHRLPFGTLQIGIAEAGLPAMLPPPGHPEAGQRVLAWYFWLFPCTMLNIYPWGISVNAVQPLGPAASRVRFSTWTWEPEGAATDAGLAAAVQGLHQTEVEDEQVVARVQRGIGARAYRGGRYAPVREDGLRHFHQLLTRALAPD